jgi:hypothetical protein
MLVALVAMLVAQQANAFCGFYVATTDVALTNKASQVIIVRDGDHTVITMSSDYAGDAKDFAMVVPVPQVLRERDIRVVQQYIFDKFSQYTAPRMVEYWDENPCPNDEAKSVTITSMGSMRTVTTPSPTSGKSDSKKGVTVEAKYVVGEYDILILSATESSGLKDWLTENGYKIPAGAGEVLDPYIKDGMKFFVVKVNLEQQKALGAQTLRPLQIQFDTPKFMLPIRLGMANADGGAQDMVVYAFTRKGRVETANYRTTKLPTDRDIPEFVMTDNLFGDFYKSTFERAWTNEGKNNVMLEYAWDISSQQPVKCDPCAGPQITFAELREAGVWWINPDQRTGGYSGDLFVTRLHARYSRKTFPQDLMFLNTPDNSRFQGRYVIHHKARGTFDCDEGERYLSDLRMRRQKELQELAALTGWSTSKWSSYLGAVEPIDPDPINVHRTSQASVEPSTDTAASADPVTPSTPTALADEQQSVAESETYLQAAASANAGGLSTRAWLFILAAGMFVAGVMVRMVGRKEKNASGGSLPS